jgi:NAD(P)-dependent dehydrogenase (short-subunit alcohol dehydrogenase family)
MLEVRTLMFSLAHKVILVSGAGSVGTGIGNGRACAILLARAGAQIAAADISEEAAKMTCELITAEGGTAIAIEADASVPDSARECVETAYKQFGRLDGLVNNVGISGAKGTAVEVDPDNWDATMRTNVKSMMLMAKYCVPHLIEAGGGGIVNIASLAGLAGGNANLAYPASKGAVVNMTRAMASQHAAARVRVNCVAPGLVFTPRVAQRGLTEEARKRRQMRAPLQIEGTGWDVAAAVCYLLSDEARWVTGVVLPVDGGRSSVITGA